MLFTIGDQVAHRVGDPGCGVCSEDYPEPCRCGGLIHATAPEDTDDQAGDDVTVLTQCDQCGRSEDQLTEEAS